MRFLKLLIVLPVFGWIALALHFQLAGATRTAALAALAVAGVVVLGRLWRRRHLWPVMMVVIAATALWYGTLTPSNTRVWAADTARGVTGIVVGDMVTLTDVRNFDWRTVDDFTPLWESRDLDLSQLVSTDVFTSAWGSPLIAHTLVSFGFADGQHVVFSAEIRKEDGEAFSALGGFFRKYELVLIAADERDILRLRTDVRGETVSLFQMQVPVELQRDMFLALVDLGNELAVTPRFYNTATANCTTMVWYLARAISPDLPFDWRLLVSGLLPEYLHDAGALGPGPLDRVRAVIPPQGPAGEDGAAFSRGVRAGFSR